MKLTKKDFVSWLAAKKPGTRVGKPGCSSDCPVANWIQAVRGTDLVYVSVWTYYIAGGIYELPKWASNFIVDVDDLECKSITARRALKILGEK